MTNRTLAFVTLVLCAAGLACADANAQAHGPPATEFLDEPEPDNPETRAARLAAVDTFLRRLAGRFREARGERNDSEKLVDCVAVGTGPGVQCMYGLGSRSNTGGATSALLFGVDPGSARVNFLRVNPKGVAEGGLGIFSGNTLHLKFPCTIPDNAKDVISCENRLQYYTVADSKEVSITSNYILRIMTPKGIVERSSVSYTWLNRIPVASSTESKAAGSSSPAPRTLIKSR